MKFNLGDQGFRARAERVNALLRPWSLVGASGSWLEAHLMARAGLTADVPKMIGSCITATGGECTTHAFVQAIVQRRKCIRIRKDARQPHMITTSVRYMREVVGLRLWQTHTELGADYLQTAAQLIDLRPRQIQPVHLAAHDQGLAQQQRKFRHSRAYIDAASRTRTRQGRCKAVD